MMNNHWSMVLDFDSTIVSIETLDYIAEISLQDDSKRNEVLKKIKNLTDAGMAGEISFESSLKKRLDLLNLNYNHIIAISKSIQSYITPSILNNTDWIKEHADRIYIFSGGFKEIIRDVVTKLDLHQEHIFANEFIYDNEGNILGVDMDNPFSQSNGKIIQADLLKMASPLIVVGDGNTDAEMKKLDIKVSFIAFTENVFRESVVKKADIVAESFDDVIRFVEDNR